MTALANDRDEVLARISIAAVLEGIVGPPRHRAWRCPSPNHAQTGNTPPVSIDEAKGVWCCHGCGAGGTAVDALMVAHGLTTAEAFARLRESAGLERRPEPPPRPPRAPVPEPAPPADALEILDAWTAARGWRPEVVEAFGLSVVRDGSGKSRVRFSFHRAGVSVWHQDRAVGPAGPKFLAPAGSSQQPYALDLDGALETAVDVGEVWIVEGVTDVVALGHLATPGRCPAVVGLPGTNYRGLPQLARALSGLIVVVVADADSAGETMRENAANLFGAAGCDVVQVRLPDGVNDLDDLRRHVDCDDEAFQRAVVAARHGQGSLRQLDQVLAEYSVGS